MGYEVKMIVGNLSNSLDPEIENDKSKPYPDGSGYEQKLDANGKPVTTGRFGRYFGVVVEIDLSKLGYQDDALNTLIKKSHAASDTFCFFYGTGDGDQEIKEDIYGNMFNAVPVADVVRAMEESYEPGEYRRIDWALALLRALPQDMSVLFYGH